MRHCHKCGKKNHHHGKHCVYCGALLHVKVKSKVRNIEGIGGRKFWGL